MNNNLIIEEFWIINWDGITLFSYSPNRDLNPSLMSGFFSVFQSLVGYVGKNEEGKFLNTILIGNYTYNFLTNQLYKLHFILKSSSKAKDKIIGRYLKKFEAMFIEEYRRDLISFDGNVAQFEHFVKKFE